MLSMDDNEYLCVWFFNIYTLPVTHMIKNINIHKLTNI
jgi:hypothetical protein